MTKEKAVSLLSQMFLIQFSKEEHEALAMAIDALNADRKTENSSEKTNNCEVKNYCDDCLYTDTCDSKEFFYACTSKATISKMEQVDKDINVRSKEEPQTDCLTCRYNSDEWDSPKCDGCSKANSHYEPQTDCVWR